MRHSFVYSISVASQSNILVSLSFTIQHPYFKIQYSTSLIQHCALTIQHLYLFQILFTCDISFVCSTSTFVASNAWCVCCAAECDMLAAQCSILVWTLNFPFPLSCAHFAAYGWCTTTWLTSSHYINQPWANFSRKTKKKRENACSLALTHVTRIEPQGLFREEVLARLLCVSFYFVTKVVCIF